jgi:predicted nucleic acid-binding Zn ribbon protein
MGKDRPYKDIISILRNPISHLLTTLRRVHDCPTCGVRFIARRQCCSEECSAEKARRDTQEFYYSFRADYDKQLRMMGFESQRFRCYKCGHEYETTYDYRSERYCSEECGYKFIHKLGNRKRRARKWKTEAIFDKFPEWEIYERDDWTCQICGLPIRTDVASPHYQSATIDHIVPLSRGGSHVRDNCQSAHFICNSLKRDLLPMQLAYQSLTIKMNTMAHRCDGAASNLWGLSA